MAQEQLADATGLTALNANGALKPLEADGLITRKRRSITDRFGRSISIRDAQTAEGYGSLPLVARVGS